MSNKPALDSDVRWRWSAERLTARVDVRLPETLNLRLWRFANMSGTTPRQVVRAALQDFLRVHAPLPSEIDR